jgi:peptide/nickel transport system permease protein
VNVITEFPEVEGPPHSEDLPATEILSAAAHRPTFRSEARRFSAHMPGVISAIVLLVIIVVAVLAPWLAPFDPTSTSRDIQITPNATHWLGTDHLGRDVFSRLLYGARTSLWIGSVTALGTLLLGVVVGSLAGYFGGWIDSALMRVSELFSVIPGFVLALVMIAIWGNSPRLIMVALILALWSQASRLVRGEVLVLTSSDMVAAAKTSGYRHRRIIMREILPCALPIIIIQGTLLVGQVVLLEAGLNFLGLGDPQSISWGGMLNEAQNNLKAWWNSVPPGAMIFILVLTINLLGDAVNQYLRPVTSHV